MAAAAAAAAATAGGRDYGGPEIDLLSERQLRLAKIGRIVRRGQDGHEVSVVIAELQRQQGPLFLLEVGEASHQVFDLRLHAREGLEAQLGSERYFVSGGPFPSLRLYRELRWFQLALILPRLILLRGSAGSGGTWVVHVDFEHALSSEESEQSVQRGPLFLVFCRSKDEKLCK